MAKPGRRADGRFTARRAKRKRGSREAMTTYAAPSVTIVREGARRRGVSRRSAPTAGGPLGFLKRNWRPMAGAFVAGKLVADGTAAKLPGYEMATAQLGRAGGMALLMYGVGYFGGWHGIMEASIGPACAALWEYGQTGKLSGDDEESAVEGSL